MGFSSIEKKGLARCLFDGDVDPERFSLHVSEIGSGTCSHEPHVHEGVEAFYVMAGQGTVEVAGQMFELAAGEAIVVDATKPHGIVNSGTETLRYAVIISKP